MKKLIIIIAAAAMTGCGIWKPYSRPEEVNVEGLYRDVATATTADSASLADLEWREVFTDAKLQTLIDRALENNTDLQIAHWRVKQSEATLKTARLGYLPSFNFAPQGNVSSFDGSPAAWTYTVPVAASWELDIFGGVTNAKRQAKAVYAQTQEYRQAVRTQLISGVANLYYSLLMLDEQYRISQETAARWREGVEIMRSMKEAGMTNEAGVSQYEANTLAVEASLHDLKYQIHELENTLSTLLGEAPQAIERGTFADQILPEELLVGVPVQMLSNRPDVRMAEFSLMQSYYATAKARSALYPSISLSGTVGWTNNAGGMIVNPGKLILSAAASLLQPIFNAGGLRAQLNIAKAQQEEALLTFQQTLLNAGGEVNNALTKVQTARAKEELRAQQVESLQRAAESTQLLMSHGTTTYLEVLTAEQALLGAQLSQVSDRYSEIQGTIELYRALGGGREIQTDADATTDKKTKKERKQK